MNCRIMNNRRLLIGLNNELQPGGGWKLYDKMRINVGLPLSNYTTFTAKFEFKSSDSKDLLGARFGGPVKFIDHYQDNYLEVFAGACANQNLYVRVFEFVRDSKKRHYTWDTSGNTKSIEIDGLYNFEYVCDDDISIKFAPTENGEEISNSFESKYTATGIYFSITGRHIQERGVTPYVEIPKIIGIFKDHTETIYPCAKPVGDSGSRYFYNFFNTNTGGFIYKGGDGLVPNDIQIDEHNNIFTVYHKYSESIS